MASHAKGITSDRVIDLRRAAGNYASQFAFLAAAVLFAFAGCSKPPGKNDPQYLELRRQADARNDAGDAAGALHIYQEARKLAPDDLAIHYQIAMTAAKARDRAAGLVAIDAMQKLNPALKNDPELIQLRQQLTVSTSAPMQPDSSEVTLAVKTAEAILRDALKAYERRDYQQTSNLVKEARESLLPAFAQYESESFAAWWALAKIAALSHDWDDAVLAALWLERLNPSYVQDPSLQPLLVELNRHAEFREKREQRLEGSMKWEVKRKFAGGMADAQAAVADEFFRGNRKPESKKLAFKLFLTAAEAGSTEAMISLAQCYLRGNEYGAPHSFFNAKTRMEEAANKGNNDAILTLACWYSRGGATWNWREGVPADKVVARDPKRAIEWLRKGAESKDARVYAALGWMLIDSEGEAERKEGLVWLDQAATRSDEVKRTIIYVIHGFTRDATNHSQWEALSPFINKHLSSRSKDDGVYLYQLEILSAMYQSRESVNDIRKALEFRKQAFELRRSLGKYDDAADDAVSIGQFYAKGLGVSHDFSEAANWFRKAGTNHSAAEFELGKLYAIGSLSFAKDKLEADKIFARVIRRDWYGGKHVELIQFWESQTNASEAVKWAEELAKLGTNSTLAPYAMFKLGEYFVRGYGVPADPNKALKLFVECKFQGREAPAAWRLLADAFDQGKNTQKNVELAKRLRSAADGIAHNFQQTDGSRGTDDPARFLEYFSPKLDCKGNTRSPSV